MPIYYDLDTYLYKANFFFVRIEKMYVHVRLRYKNVLYVIKC